MFRFLKTKVGFTLVELLVVVLIIGTVVAIGIPTYQGISRNNRKRVCAIQRREVLAELKDWCDNNQFNYDYTFTITSDSSKGTVVAEKLQKEITEKGKKTTVTLINSDMIINDALDNDIPYCPSSGTYTIVMTERPASIVHLAISCHDNSDEIDHE